MRHCNLIGREKVTPLVAYMHNIEVLTTMVAESHFDNLRLNPQIVSNFSLT